MGTLLVLAASNLATMFLTAWLLRCAATGRSPIPVLPRAVSVENGDAEPQEVQPAKGRPRL